MAIELRKTCDHPLGERGERALGPVPETVTADSFAGKLAVRWAPEEAVTPLGQLPFYIESLKQADVFEARVGDAPLAYTSPNAPAVRHVLGTVVLSMVAGARRYALRNDGVDPRLMRMKRVCSDDSVRRAMGRMEAGEAGSWLGRHLETVWRPSPAVAPKRAGCEVLIYRLPVPAIPQPSLN